MREKVSRRNPGLCATVTVIIMMDRGREYKRQGVTLLDGPLANYPSRQKILGYTVYGTLDVCTELRARACVCITFVFRLVS